MCSSRSRTMTPSGWSTHLEAHVPLSQTWLHTGSALAACESANHRAAVAMPIKNLLIGSLHCTLPVNFVSPGLVPDLCERHWAREFQRGAGHSSRLTRST